MTPQGWIALAGLWILFFFFYKRYRLDVFRQKMFAIRDDLFDLAQSGKLEFSSDAYKLFRTLVNVNIQFGHQLGFLNGLFICLASRNRQTPTPKFEQAWEKSQEGLGEDVKVSLKKLRDRVHLCILEQMVFTSVVLMFSLVAVALGLLMLVAKRVVWLLFEKAMGKLEFSSFMLRLESLAMTRSVRTHC